MGAVHVTAAWAFPALATTFDGAPGRPIGVTDAEGEEAGPAPFAFVATTVNV